MDENELCQLIKPEQIKKEFVVIKKEKPDEIYVPNYKIELAVPPLVPIKVGKPVNFNSEPTIPPIKIEQSELDYDESTSEIKEESEERPKNKNVFYSCNDCEFMTKFKWCFDDHVSTNHKVQVVEKIPEYIRCELCPFKSRTEYNLSRHFKQKHGKRIYNCTYCNHITSNKSNLRRHIFSLHLQVDRKTTEYECEYCDYKTKSKSNLKRHTLSKHLSNKSDEYKCTYCEYTSTDGSNLKEHTRKHETKTSKCEFCDFTTKSSKYLKVHMKKHTRDRIKCPHCDVTVYHSRHLFLHMKTYHSSENKEIRFEEVFIKSEKEEVDTSPSSSKYNCDKCLYKTNKKCNLDKHRLYRHTDVDKIDWLCCPHCSYKAKTKERYKKHLRIHKKIVKEENEEK